MWTDWPKEILATKKIQELNLATRKKTDRARDADAVRSTKGNVQRRIPSAISAIKKVTGPKYADLSRPERRVKDQQKFRLLNKSAATSTESPDGERRFKLDLK